MCKLWKYFSFLFSLLWARSMAFPASTLSPARQRTCCRTSTKQRPRRQLAKTCVRLAPAATMSEVDEKLALSVISFAASHIGMSAIRTRIINACGNVADSVSLVGNKDWALPGIWSKFGDGTNMIFPTKEVAGRQIYRFLYTLVSFATLGSAFGFYIQSHQCIEVPGGNTSLADGYFWIAVVASAASILSLANASPLGLMPGFRKPSARTDESIQLLLQRDDSLKFEAKGLTRVTRHPLILPVVPWGLANAKVLGGDLASWLLFGGLAIYAILGCSAQDLRVSRQEGSVGTTFGDFDELERFFRSTSFWPFGAVLQGKQSLKDIILETPWLVLIFALPIGFGVETAFVNWLS